MGDRSRPAPWFASQWPDGESFTLHGQTITPQAHQITLRLPSFVLTWQRPSGVLVRHGQQTSCLPIRDVTRLIQCALLGIALLAIGALALAAAKE